jgi:hypothetical protein
MASERLRRAAGAQGVGDGSGEPDSAPPAKDESKTIPEQTQKTLAPELLRFNVVRQVQDPDTGTMVDKQLTLVVPTQFTLGDLIQREVSHDFDAYVRLVMVELRRTSSIDVKANPQLMFSRENMEYLDVVLVASNVRSFMGRVLSRSAYLIDPEDADEKHLAVRVSDVDALSDEVVLTIGASYVNRWLERWIESHKINKAAADSKNSRGAAQT